MAKKHSTKRKAAQQQLRQLRRQPVNYFEVPKPLWKRIKPLLPKPPKQEKARATTTLEPAGAECHLVCVVDWLSMEGVGRVNSLGLE